MVNFVLVLEVPFRPLFDPVRQDLIGQTLA